MTSALDPTTTYVHLGEGPEVQVLPVTEDFWPTIGERVELQRGRLVTAFDQDRDWTTWEMHPDGDEIVLALRGALALRLEAGAGESRVELDEGRYVVIPKGTWHTADVREPGRILVITWGEGTLNRPR